MHAIKVENQSKKRVLTSSWQLLSCGRSMSANGKIRGGGLLVAVFFCLHTIVYAQGVLAETFNGSEQGRLVVEVLQEWEKTKNARFYFAREWIAPIKFNKDYRGQSLEFALTDVFLGTDLNFVAMYPSAVVIIKDPTQALLRKSALQSAIESKKRIITFTFGAPGGAVDGKPVTISGTVIDGKTKEPMRGATIRLGDTTQGTTTDEMGRYQLTLPIGVHVLSFSFVNYEEKVIDLAAYENGVIDVVLEETPVYLDEIVVQDRADREVAVTRIGQTQISMKEIKRAPAMLGEVDLIRTVQMLPGVATVGEAASGFNVRGGSVDQNLILYDGMPMFNSSHVFGFLSTFNPEAIREVSFYRGGMPAEFGGRASSVLDIRSKDGDMNKWNGNAGIGLMTSNLMVNGPLKKDKTSIAASFRGSYSNWLIHAVRSDYGNLKNSSVFFYDATLKITHIINPKTRLSFTGYGSQDSFRLGADSTYRWNNLQLSFRLDHQFSPALAGEFSVGRSAYGYSVLTGDSLNGSDLSYKLAATVIKAGFNYVQDQHKFSFGWQLTPYGFEPGSIKATSDISGAGNYKLPKQHSLENAFYASDSWSKNDRLFIDAGLRIPFFLALGKSDVVTYQAGAPREASTAVDTLHFKPGSVVKGYLGVEPRLAVRWMVRPDAAFKLGYGRTYQYLHLITNTAAVSPVDVWQPSGYYFKPQRADQVSAGYFLDFKQKSYNTSVEVFYKFMDNVLDFKDGAKLILNNTLETSLLQGKGYAYGVETTFAKNVGKLNASFNYTYSRSFRQVAGPTNSESINQGKRYPSNFDQPHIVNLTWKYALSRRHFLTGNFTYHTGRPVSVPVAIFKYDNGYVAYFSERNQYRIPDYHRLDLALVIEGNHKRKKLGDGTWILSIYNVYARKNVYSVFFRDDGSGALKPYRLSIIGTILPSVSYNVKF